LKKQPWRFGSKCKIRVSLIVWAIAEGGKTAAGMDKYHSPQVPPSSQPSRGLAPAPLVPVPFPSQNRLEDPSRRIGSSHRQSTARPSFDSYRPRYGMARDQERRTAEAGRGTIRRIHHGRPTASLPAEPFRAKISDHRTSSQPSTIKESGVISARHRPAGVGYPIAYGLVGLTTP